MTAGVTTALFDGLTPAAARDIAALGVSRLLKTGDVLFALGDVADSLYLVERGRIALTLPMDVEGHDRDLLVEERRPGEIVGWSALVPPHRFTLDAHAVADSVVLALPRAALLDYFDANPAAGRRVTANVTAVVGHLLHVFQTMWLREVSRSVRLHVAQEGVRP